MINQLPWPQAYLASSAWKGVRRLLTRCLDLQEADGLPATLMLLGEVGLGREALAIELAAGLVCRQGNDVGCECPSCARVRRGVHPDVEVIDVLPDKEEISIDQARQVAESVARRPYEGRRRVFVVNSCHTPPLNAEAASALLKTLEEPPSHATFILLASNPARVLPTIVSRAVQVRIPPPSREELLTVLVLARDCSCERATELLAAAEDDAALAVRGATDELPNGLGGLQPLLVAALAGDGFAILRVANALPGNAAGTDLAAAALLSLATNAGAEATEAWLNAAAALLVAESRRAALNLTAESTQVATLAGLASSSRPR